MRVREWGAKVETGRIPRLCHLGALSQAAVLAYRDRRDAAGYAVNEAIRRGALPPVRGQACVDCGRPATLYEHRDYYKPLEVVPACRPCNRKRGRASDFPPALYYMTAAEAAYRGIDGMSVPPHLSAQVDAYFAAKGLAHIKGSALPRHACLQA